MSAIVSIGPMKMIIEIVAKLKKHDVNVVPYIWGAHAVGKTSIVRQVAKKIGYNCVVLNLANQTPEDLLGYPDGKGGFIMPNWLAADGKPTIYFLDEINRAPKYVLQSMFNFINEGRIHQHFIGKHDVVIAAGNPPDQRYDTVEFDDIAFLSRFAHFYLEPTPAEYLNYLDATGAHKALVNAVKTSPGKFCTTTKPEFMLQCKPDHRTGDKMGQILNFLDKHEIEEIGHLLFSAMAGSDFAAIVIRQWKETMTKVMSGEEILNTAGIEFSFDKRGIDMVTIMSSNVAEYVKTKLYNEKTKKFTINATQKENFCKYANYLTAEGKVAFLAEIKRKIGLAIVDLMEVTLGLDDFNSFMEANQITGSSGKK